VSSSIETVAETVEEKDPSHDPLLYLNQPECHNILTVLECHNGMQFVGVLDYYSQEDRVISMKRGGHRVSDEPWFWKIAIPVDGISCIRRMTPPEKVEYMKSNRDVHGDQYTNKYCTH
jgi:hypothetical protein